MHTLPQGWLPEDRVDAAMNKYDIDNSGDIDFEEFKQMVYDGLFLEGTIAEYEEAFAAVDKSGNGSIGERW
jgi:Ca2+-binding EF-hand superfamily protein